jgi:hypothetical protein
MLAAFDVQLGNLAISGCSSRCYFLILEFLADLLPSAAQSFI